MDIIDIAKYRAAAKADLPFYVDGSGVKWFTYAAEYTDDDGAVFSLNIPAKTFEDAESRLRRIGSTGKIIGTLAEEIPV